MESPQPAPPVNPTGLPPGVEVGGLGKRFLAHLIDRLVPALLIAAGIYLGPRVGGVEGFLIQVAAVVLTLAWALFVWWGFAVRAAGPGMRLMRLQLVGFYDGLRLAGCGFFSEHWCWLPSTRPVSDCC